MTKLSLANSPVINHRSSSIVKMIEATALHNRETGISTGLREAGGISTGLRETGISTRLAIDLLMALGAGALAAAQSALKNIRLIHGAALAAHRRDRVRFLRYLRQLLATAPEALAALICRVVQQAIGLIAPEQPDAPPPPHLRVVPTTAPNAPA